MKTCWLYDTTHHITESLWEIKNLRQISTQTGDRAETRPPAQYDQERTSCPLSFSNITGLAQQVQASN